jgi:hypothetical protein
MRSRFALVALAASVALVVPAVTSSASTADKGAIGYHLRLDGTAAGGWLGARKIWPRLVYRLDPGAHRSRTPGFGPAWRAGVLHGSGPVTVTRRATARAAYLLSAYGTRRDHRAQNAAVEIALDQLLVGGRYGRHGTRTLARLRQTADAAEIGYLADYMLADSLDFAGPYRVAIGETGATLGGVAQVRVRVTSTVSGRPFATLPVVVRVPGLGPQVRETDADGRVAVSWQADRSGLLDVAVTVREVPESRLLVRRPTRLGASRIAIAGVKRALVRHVRVPVQAHPSVSIAQPLAARTDTPTKGTFTVSSGVDSPRKATATLFGPYDAAADAVCSGPSAGEGVMDVSANGDYPLPALSLTDVGYYVWGVALAANRVNEPATACGSPFVARVVPQVSVKVPDNSLAAGTALTAWWRVGLLPEAYTGDLTVRLFGPYADADQATCSVGSGRSEKIAITADASGWSTSYTPTQAGVYAWRITLPGSEFSTWAPTVCGGAGTMVRVVTP